MAAFRSLVAGADFSVIEQVFASDVRGRKIGHHHIGTCQNALFPTKGMNGAQRRGGRQQHTGEHQPQDAQQMQRSLQSPCRFIPESGILMGNKWSNADHMGLERLHKPKILYDIFRGLIGRAHHNSTAHLIADLLEIPQAALSVLNTQLRRMQHAIMRRIGRFLPQKIPLRSRIEIRLIAFPALLANGQRNRAVRMVFMNGSHQLAHPLIGIPGVLAPLQHKGSEAQLIALFAAVQNLLPAQAIPLGILIAPSNATVIAVVFADIGELNEPPEIDLVPINLVAHPSRRFIKIF